MENRNLNIDLATWFEQAQAQFRNLNPNEPGQWPILPKIAVFTFTAIAVVALGWFALLADQANDLQRERDQEPKLKEEFRTKVAKAVNLNELRKQRIQVEEYVKQLEKQLPGKAEMDALLSDINQAGLGRGLEFELFRPGQSVVKDYYAELPIAVRVTGRYHDIGSFTADVANLSRIVTLHNLNIAPANTKDAQSGSLFMEATARTYRYLDQAELDAMRAEQKAKDGKKKKGGKKK